MANKSEIRREVRKRRKQMTAAQRRRASARICGRLWELEPFREARLVAVYMALAGEVDPAPCLARCWELGIRICVPTWSAATRRYGLALLRRGEPCLTGPMRVLQPVRPDWVPVTMLDVVVAPGLSFDTLGNRIGFGGGHYDRLLSRCNNCCTRIGVAFEWQLRRCLPSSAHDETMHYVVTETRTLKCV